MENMKILVIAPTPYFSDRGCHVRIYEEAKALIKKGHQVCVCTYHLGRDVGDFPIKRTINIPWYKKTSAGPAWQKVYIDLFLILKSLREARKFKPDVIHGHLHEGSLIGWVVKLFIRKPLVFDYQGSLTGEIKSHGFGKLVMPLFRIAEKIANRKPDRIVISNIKALSELKDQFGIDPSKITLVADAVGSRGKSTIELRKKFKLKDDDIIAIYLGVLTDYQGTDILVDAAQILEKENPKIKIIAYGFPEKKYKREVEKRGLNNIVFPGALDYEASINTLSQADIALSPKKASTEGNGKLFSYIAAGLASVVFDNDVNRSILGDNAFYCSQREASEYAKTIVDALADKRRIKEIQNNLVEVIKVDNWSKQVERLINIYKKAVTGKKEEKKYKILMLNYEFPPIGGGAANANYYYLKEFAKMPELNITFVTSGLEDKVYKFSDNITFHSIRIKKKNLHYWTQKEVLKYLIKHRRYLKKKIDVSSYDLVHAFFTIPSGILAYINRKKTPYIISIRGSDVPGFNPRFKLHYPVIRMINRRIWSNAERVISQSDGLASLARKTSPGLEIDNIPKATKFDDFKRSELKTDETYQILCVARLIKRKGINYLINAMPQIIKKIDCKLIIAGTGNLDEKLKEQVRNLGLENKVDFKGYVKHEKVIDLYAQSSLFVLPSYLESRANALNEAMAYGLTVITTDAEGTREMIDGNGILIKWGDYKGIANAAIKILSDKEKMKEMGEKSYQLASGMSWEKSANKYLDTYRRLIAD